MDQDRLQLRDLSPADPFIQSPGWPWWAWLILALGLVGIALLVRFAVKRGDTSAGEDPRVVAERAYRQAVSDIGDSARESGARAVAIACSTAIRRYLSTVCGDPSLFETHEEFLSRHEALKGFPGSIRERTGSVFAHLAALKYGRSPNGDAAEIVDGCRDLLGALHQSRPA